MFQKGKSGNPGGRPKLPERLAKVRKLTRDEVNLTFAKYCQMTFPDMNAILSHPEKRNSIPMLDLWICTGIANGVKTGDWKNMVIMFDRIFGKPKEIEEQQTENKMVYSTQIGTDGQIKGILVNSIVDAEIALKSHENNTTEST